MQCAKFWQEVSDQFSNNLMKKIMGYDFRLQLIFTKHNTYDMFILAKLDGFFCENKQQKVVPYLSKRVLCLVF